jgi:NTE family protein
MEQRARGEAISAENAARALPKRACPMARDLQNNNGRPLARPDTMIERCIVRARIAPAFFLFLLACVALLPAAPRPKVAVVLSGGSALGMAHVGVLQVIEKAGIPIDMVLGTSMGSIVGGLYAAGYSPDQMDAIITQIDWSNVFTERRDSPGDRYDWLKRERFPLRLGFDRHGVSLGAALLSGQNVLSLFTELTLHDLAVRDFDELPVPYRAVAADILTGEKVVISRGSLAEAMRCSMSIPGIFRPFETGGRTVVDGGIADNMPVDVARQMGADIVIAVESRLGNPRSAESLTSSLAITAQTLNLLIQQNMIAARRDADLVISPDLHEYNMMSYNDAVQIVQRGREGGQAAWPKLEELAEMIAKARPLVKPEEQANRAAYHAPAVLSGLTVEGGSEADAKEVRRVFAPLEGAPMDREQVRRAIEAAYATGRFDLVTFDLAPGPAGSGQAEGVVHLVPDTTAENAVFLGENFRALFTTVTDSVSQLSAGAMLRDLTGRDSALYVEAGFMDKRRAYAEYFQPLGPFFFMPFFRYESQFDGYYITPSDVYHTLFQTTGGGLWTGLTVTKHLDVLVGYSWESVLAYGFGGTVDNNTVGTLGAALRLDTFRTTIFPENGISTMVRGRWADPSFGGTTAFTALEWNLAGAIPLSKRFTLGLTGYLASDFSGLPGVSTSIPAERLFSIRQPGMFYGLEPRPETGVGNHVAAGALELRYELGSLSPLLGIDIYALANLSAAAVRQGLPGDVDFVDFFPLRWDASLGLGARITEHTGVMAALSWVNDNSTTISPQRLAFTLEVGTFAQFLEDKR